MEFINNSTIGNIIVYSYINPASRLEDAKIVEEDRSTDGRNAKCLFLLRATKCIMLLRRLGFACFHIRLFQHVHSFVVLYI